MMISANRAQQINLVTTRESEARQNKKGRPKGSVYDQGINLRKNPMQATQLTFHTGLTCPELSGSAGRGGEERKEKAK